MKNTIDITLSTESIDSAIRELRDYKKWLERKAEELRKRLGALIKEKAEPVFASAIADDVFAEQDDDGKYIDADARIGGVTVSVSEQGNVTVVIASGKDAVFMEFGAGVYYNGNVGSSPNPLSAKNNLGYTIGEYGQGKGARRVWYFKDEDGHVYKTHGTPASMPLYKAVTAVRGDLEKIASEVFSR